MKKTLFAIGLAACSFAAAPAPTTQPMVVGDQAWQRFVQEFARPTTRPQVANPYRVHPVDPMMPNAIPPRYDLRRLPRYPVPMTPSTRPSNQTAPYLMLPDGAHVMPPGWKSFNFNGGPVYIIPLKADGQPTTKPAAAH